MDPLVYHIDYYVTTTSQPTLSGLQYHLFKYSDNDFRDKELESKLELYLQWLIEDERYEECTFVQQMIKEYANRSF